jgi:hypothetical protein
MNPQRELLGGESAADDPSEFDRSATVVDFIRRAGALVSVFELDDVSERAALERQWRASEADMIARGQCPSRV